MSNNHVTLMTLILSGIFALIGCAPTPLIQDPPEGSASLPTPSTSGGTTLIPENETATVAPSPTSTPPPSPTAAEVATSFEEPFDDNRNQWREEPNLLTVAEGKYVHQIDCPDTHVSPQCGTFIRMPFTFPRSFRMEIDATLVDASAGAGLLVAFQVRRSDVHYYFISYSITDGSYQMSYISQNGMTGIVPETPTGLIQTPLGVTNRLGIEARGFLFTPLINGQAADPVQEATIREAGDSYLVILVERGGSAELHFDNLVVMEVK